MTRSARLFPRSPTRPHAGHRGSPDRRWWTISPGRKRPLAHPWPLKGGEDGGNVTRGLGSLQRKIPPRRRWPGDRHVFPAAVPLLPGARESPWRRRASTAPRWPGRMPPRTAPAAVAAGGTGPLEPPGHRRGFPGVSATVTGDAPIIPSLPGPGQVERSGGEAANRDASRAAQTVSSAVGPTAPKTRLRKSTPFSTPAGKRRQRTSARPPSVATPNAG